MQRITCFREKSIKVGKHAGSGMLSLHKILAKILLEHSMTIILMALMSTIMPMVLINKRQATARNMARCLIIQGKVQDS